MCTFQNPNNLIAVTSRKLCSRPLDEQVYRIAAAGITKIILREKDLSEEEYLRLAQGVMKSCRQCGVMLTIHNFPNVARKLGISRLHMPLSGLTTEICEEFETVGSSIHSCEQAVTAQAVGADYITAGHIYITDCKKGLEPRGLEFLREVCEAVSIPVYGIGGINSENVQTVIDAGAKGACIMSQAMRI